MSLKDARVNKEAEKLPASNTMKYRGKGREQNTVPIGESGWHNLSENSQTLTRKEGEGTFRGEFKDYRDIVDAQS